MNQSDMQTAINIMAKATGQAMKEMRSDFESNQTKRWLQMENELNAARSAMENDSKVAARVLEAYARDLLA